MLRRRSHPIHADSATDGRVVECVDEHAPAAERRSERARHQVAPVAGPARPDPVGLRTGPGEHELEQAVARHRAQPDVDPRPAEDGDHGNQARDPGEPGQPAQPQRGGARIVAVARQGPAIGFDRQFGGPGHGQVPQAHAAPFSTRRLGRLVGCIRRGGSAARRSARRAVPCAAHVCVPEVHRSTAEHSVPAPRPVRFARNANPMGPERESMAPPARGRPSLGPSVVPSFRRTWDPASCWRGAAGRGFALRRSQRDAGKRPGMTTTEHERLKELERENRELKRANEILRQASALFAQAELDRKRR